MANKGTAVIDDEFYLRWKTGVWGEDFGRGCALEFDAWIFRKPDKAVAGRFNGYLLFPRKLRSGDLFELCDSHCGNLCHLAEEITLNCGDLAAMNLFHLDTMEIEPKFRGRRLGITALQKIVEIALRRFRVDICTLHPFPLQYSGSSAGGTRAFEKARKKLAAYYRENLPIREMREGSEFYVWEVG